MGLRYDDKPVQRLLDNANKNLGPFIEDVLSQIGKKILRRVQTNLSGRILKKRTGYLHNSWDYVIRPLGLNKIQLIVGSIRYFVPYAQIHDTGGMAGRGHKVRIPARHYYSRVPEEVAESVNTIIRNKLNKLFGK